MQKKLFSLFLSLILSYSLFSQDIKPCGTQDVDLTSWIETMKSNNVYPDFSKKLQTRDVIYIPIHYHIVTRSDKTDGFPLYYVMEMHCDLNRNYRNSNVGIQFYIDSITYVNSDTYFEINSQVEDYLLSKTYNSLNACNVYIVNDPNGACGYTRRPQLNTSPSNRTSIFLKGSFVEYKCTEPGSTTLSHEMGHWLDLPHTFNGWEGRTYGTSNAPSTNQRERVVRTGSQSNCYYYGDGFCDTDPDYNSQRWSCPSGKYYVDPLGESFVLNPENYMCYASDECTSKFSAEQIIQMNDAMNNYRERSDLLDLPTPSTETLDSFSYFFPKAITSIEKIILEDDNIFRFSKIESADKYLFTLAKGGLVLNNDFKILPGNILMDTFITDTFISIPKSLLGVNEYYYWTVRPVSKLYTCGTIGAGILPLRFEEIDVKVNVTHPTCAGYNDGVVTIEDNSNIATNLYSLDNSSFSSDTEISFLEAGPKILYIKSSSNLIYLKEFTLNEPIEVTGTVTVNGNKATVKNVKGKSPFTYAWSNDEDGISQTLDKGDYEVVITDDNGCVSEPIPVKITQDLNQNSSISNSINNKIDLYPTLIKTGDKVTINHLSKNTNYSIEIVDITGRILQTETIRNQSSSTFEWNVKQKGIYIIRINSENNNTAIKVQAI